MSAADEQRAVDALTQIGATTAVMQLDQIAQQAAAGQWSYTHFLGRLQARLDFEREAARIVDEGGRYADVMARKPG